MDEHDVAESLFLDEITDKYNTEDAYVAEVMFVLELDC